jgi:hypothetical protein
VTAGGHTSLEGTYRRLFAAGGYVSWAGGRAQIVVLCRGDDSSGFCLITSACWRVPTRPAAVAAGVAVRPVILGSADVLLADGED